MKNAHRSKYNPAVTAAVTLRYRAGSVSFRPVPQRRWWAVLGQVIAFGAGIGFLLRTAATSWGTIALADLRPDWLPILAGSILTAATYLFLVWLWVASLAWWGERFAYLEAARVWFVSNLARFIPGMVWQLAGVAAMAHARAVSPVAATAAILLQQIVLVVTGLAVAAAWAPAVLARWSALTSPAHVVVLAMLAMVLLVVWLPRMVPGLGRLAGRLLRRPVSWPAMPTSRFALYVAGLCLPWVSYGVSFWLFGVGLLGSRGPGLGPAIGAFVASYVAGLIVVFAPSGLVVREAALVATLSPSIGGGPALVLALASRLWLLVVELLTALAVVGLHALGPSRVAGAGGGAGRG